MSSVELKNFFKLIHPFELLNENELENVVSLTEISYYRKGEELISSKNIPQILFLILKGRVLELNGEDVISIYNEYDSFDAKSLLYNRCENRFIVDEELICYELPKEKFIQLVQNHTSFKTYFVEGLAKKIEAIQERERSGALSSFMLAKVSDIFLHSATIVNPETSIIEALQEKESSKSSAILVKDGDKFSIVTDTNLRERVLLAQKDINDPISDIAVSPLKSVDFNDFLFNALLILVKHNIKRLPVLKNGEIVGILEQMDILSHFSNQSHLIVVQIEKAQSINELMEISEKLLSLIRALHEKGVKVRHSSKLINELNKKIYKKLALLTFPKELHSQITIFVMGSEGRREQILKTDQDNGIFLKDISYLEDVLKYSAVFTERLIGMGYPKCDGDIMVSNPYWVDTKENFKSRISQFIEKPTPKALMELAIIFDGDVVFGDEKPMREIKEFIISKMGENSYTMNSFANATLMFETPLTLFKNFLLDEKHGGELNIKKGGIFAIVHGVRALSIEHSIFETNSVERVKALNNIGIINREFALELIEAFDTLLSLRLVARLSKIDSGKEVDNYLNPASISHFKRDILKDSFKIVDRFKKFITYHFKLDRIG